MTGQCIAPGFDSAGGHWNPTNRGHGSENPAGMHKGDMPNILIGTNGAGTLEYTIAAARISGSSDALLDEDGARLEASRVGQECVSTCRSRRPPFHYNNKVTQRTVQQPNYTQAHA